MNDLMEKRLASIVERPWARQLWAMKPNLSSARQIASSPSFQFQLGMFSRWAWGNKTRYETLLCPMFNCLESLLGNTVLPNYLGSSRFVSVLLCFLPGSGTWWFVLLTAVPDFSLSGTLFLSPPGVQVLSSGWLWSQREPIGDFLR